MDKTQPWLGSIIVAVAVAVVAGFGTGGVPVLGGKPALPERGHC